MKSDRIQTRTLLLGVLFGVTVAAAVDVWADKATGTPARLPLDEVRTFTEIFGRIKNDYVEPVGDKTLLENAIRGMLSGLDPHSTYLDQEAFKELQVGTTGEFGGLGIEVGIKDGFIKVISPIDDTPAQRAGIKAGDLIIRLNDTPVKGMDLNDAVKLMRGKPGSQLTLTILRDGSDVPLKFSLKRDIIQVVSVKKKYFPDGFGYLRISSFQARTGNALRDALEELKERNKGRLKGLVLDLRNNPGGVLSAAVSVCDAFIEDGLIVYTEGRARDSRLEFKATHGDALDGAPIVVLVNGGSASASEIVAGALQDHQRAVIMGRKTFGKGSVQTIIPMRNSTAIKLTTARYYTPKGRSIQAQGIVPDVPLENVELAKKKASVQPLKEANLSRHLKNGNGGKPQPKDGDAGDGKVSKDYPLHEALNLLRGLYILKATG